MNGPVILENSPSPSLHKLEYSLTLQLSKAHSWIFLLEKFIFTQKSVPEYSWQLYLWPPQTGNQPGIFHWVNASVIHLYNDILFTDFSQLSIELCLNKPFSVESVIDGKCI